jgi:hypothetical protein
VWIAALGALSTAAMCPECRSGRRFRHAHHGVAGRGAVDKCWRFTPDVLHLRTLVDGRLACLEMGTQAGNEPWRGLAGPRGPSRVSAES